MNKEKWLSIVRHSLTFVGGILIATGWVSETLVMEISGVVITLLTTIWGVNNKKTKI
jgi:hypothetical protein